MILSATTVRSLRFSQLHSSSFILCRCYSRFSPRLQQLYKSVEEHPEPVEGKVHGVIPPWLSGRLVRNGPGKLEVGDTKYNHLFDGLSLLHSFTIDQGKVWYQSRFLRSDTYKKNMAANRIVVTEFGTLAHPDPCKTLFQRMFSFYKHLRNPEESFSDNCVVNVIPIGDKVIASTEGDIVHQIDCETLDTVKKHKYSKHVAINHATAHAHQDYDGTVYNLGNSYNRGAMYNVIKIPPSKQGEELLSRSSVLSQIPAKDKFAPGYYHSFGMTKNYFLFIEQSLKLELRKLFLSIYLRRKPFSELVSWNPEENVRFYVIEKASGKIMDTHFTAPAFLFFHIINTYEENGHIVVDICALEDDRLFHSPFSELTGPMARRYVLPLAGGRDSKEDTNLVTLKNTEASAILQSDGSIFCTHEKLCSIPFDLPQINYQSFNGRKYNFVYSIAVEKFLLGDIDLLKLNVSSGATKRWNQRDCSPSEPVFVPHPDALEEDDGVILSAVLHRERKASPFLLVLDAKTMDELGRVEFEGIEMHKDFHGIFQQF